MSYEAILAKLVELLEEELDRQDVNEETNFMNDLVLDTEEYEVLGRYIKEELGIEVTQDILDDCQTVGDLATYIEENM